MHQAFILIKFALRAKKDVKSGDSADKIWATRQSKGRDDPIKSQAAH